MQKKIVAVNIISYISIFFIAFLLLTNKSVRATGCTVVSFTHSPGSPVEWGTEVNLAGTGDCDGGVRAVRFSVDGTPKAEIGLPSQTETWKTNEFSPGSHTVCFHVAGGSDASWEAGAESCVVYQVTGGPSDQCYVDSFDVAPTNANVGDFIDLEGSGSCDDGVRAVRFLINGTPHGEFGGPSTSTTWGTDGFAPGDYQIGFQVVHGDWSTAAVQYKTVTLSTTPQESDQCYVDSFDVAPTNANVGDFIDLEGSGSCDDGVRAVRFLINGTPHGEFGGPSTSTTWNTTGYAPGDYQIGFQVVHGDWNTAAVQYKTVSIPPILQESDQCNVDSFDVSYTNAPVETIINLTGSGSCDDGVRAVRFLINGTPHGEFGGPSTSTTWNTSGYAPGDYQIGFQVVHGDWSTAAVQYKTITLSATPQESDQCYINAFNMSAGSGPVGTTFTFEGIGECDDGVRAIRFLINGTPFSEFAGPSQTTNWRTNDLAPGEYQIGFQVAHGDWDTAATEYKTITLESLPQESDDCSIDSFEVSSTSVKVGTTINLSGSGSCDDGVRAIRFLINDAPHGEFGGPSTSTTWNTTGYAPGNYQIGFQVVHGDWNTAATQFRTVSIGVETPEEPAITSPTQPTQEDSCTYDWEKDDLVSLRSGAQIRFGSAFFHDAHTTIQVDDWPVEIIGGPRYEDNGVWFNISRANIDGGGSGWVEFTQANFEGCAPNASPPLIIKDEVEQLTCDSAIREFQLGSIVGLSAGQQLFSTMANDASVPVTIITRPTAVKVIEGPIFDNGLEWWRVDQKQACGFGFESGWIYRISSYEPISIVETEPSSDSNNDGLSLLPARTEDDESELVWLPEPKEGYEWVSASWFGAKMEQWLNKLAELEVKTHWRYSLANGLLTWGQFLTSLGNSPLVEGFSNVTGLVVCESIHEQQRRALNNNEITWRELVDKANCFPVDMLFLDDDSSYCIPVLHESFKQGSTNFLHVQQQQKHQLHIKTSVLELESNLVGNRYGDYIQLPTSVLNHPLPKASLMDMWYDALTKSVEFYGYIEDATKCINNLKSLAPSSVIISKP